MVLYTYTYIHYIQIWKSTWISFDLQHHHWLHWVNKQLLVKIYIFFIHSYNFHLYTARAHGRKICLLYTVACALRVLCIRENQQEFFLFLNSSIFKSRGKKFFYYSSRRKISLLNCINVLLFLNATESTN